MLASFFESRMSEIVAAPPDLVDVTHGAADDADPSATGQTTFYVDGDGDAPGTPLGRVHEAARTGATSFPWWPEQAVRALAAGVRGGEPAGGVVMGTSLRPRHDRGRQHPRMAQVTLRAAMVACVCGGGILLGMLLGRLQVDEGRSAEALAKEHRDAQAHDDALDKM